MLVDRYIGVERVVKSGAKKFLYKIICTIYDHLSGEEARVQYNQNFPSGLAVNRHGVILKNNTLFYRLLWFGCSKTSKIISPHLKHFLIPVYNTMSNN